MKVVRARRDEDVELAGLGERRERRPRRVADTHGRTSRSTGDATRPRGRRRRSNATTEAAARARSRAGVATTSRARSSTVCPFIARHRYSSAFTGTNTEIRTQFVNCSDTTNFFSSALLRALLR